MNNNSILKILYFAFLVKNELNVLICFYFELIIIIIYKIFLSCEQSSFTVNIYPILIFIPIYYNNLNEWTAGVAIWDYKNNPHQVKLVWIPMTCIPLPITILYQIQEIIWQTSSSQYMLLVVVKLPGYNWPPARAGSW